MPARHTASVGLMRDINRSAVLDVMREHSPISRQVAKRLDLSLSTVVRAIDDLIHDDLVRPHGRAESSGGRPRELLEFNTQAYAVVGVDFCIKLFGTVADLAGKIQNELYLR